MAQDGSLTLSNFFTMKEYARYKAWWIYGGCNNEEKY
jgi:hypothetical protein